MKMQKTCSSIVSILLVQNLSPLLWRRFIRPRCDIWNGLPGTNTVAYFEHLHQTRLKGFASDKGSSLLWLFTLDHVERACQEQTLKLITNIHIRLGCLGQKLQLISNIDIRLGWKSLPETKALAYYEHLQLITNIHIRPGCLGQTL